MKSIVEWNHMSYLPQWHSLLDASNYNCTIFDTTSLLHLGDRSPSPYDIGSLARSLAGSNGVTSEERSLARSLASLARRRTDGKRGGSVGRWSEAAAAAVMAARSEEGRRGGNGWRRRSVRSVSERAVCNNEEQTDLEPRKEVFAAMHNT